MRRALAGFALLAAMSNLLAGTAVAQEIPQVGSGKTTVHQFGIIRSGLPGGQKPALLDLPKFVHTAETTSTFNSWLDFSAMYFHPPLMMKEPLQLDVRLSCPAITAWYPYAHETSNTMLRAWDDVSMGVQADGLETSHPHWMTARAMESAATVKVYKPGPAGSKPDDEGTTEGDVFLFLRGQSYADFIQVEADSQAKQWMVMSRSVFSDVQYPLDETNQQAWIAEPRDGEIWSRGVILDGKTSDGVALNTPSTVEVEPYSRRSMDLRSQLNEAFSGNGLRSDEAAAQAKLVLESISAAKGPVLIYLLTQKWVDQRFRMEINGPAEKPVRVFVVVADLPAVK